MNESTFWADVPLLGGLSPEQLEEVCSFFETRLYPKGTRVFDEGMSSRRAYIVFSGAVKVYRTDDGREYTIDILGKGDVFGDMELIDPVKARLLSVIAMHDSVLYTLDREIFHHIIDNFPTVKDRLMQLQVERLMFANEKLHEMKTRDARTRLVSTLQQLYSKFGMQNDEGCFIELRLTHQDLADMVGALRETITILVKNLQQQQWIRMQSQRIYIIDPERFMSL